MLVEPQPPRIQLPKGWQGCVKSAVLYAIALSHYAIVYARAWAADSINARVRLAAENDRLHQECALLREELRLKDARMAQIVPQREPVNKFPDFVRYIVQRLKTLNPSMGKVKIAETLCRAGLHLGVTTVGRILKEAPQSDPGDAAPCSRVVTARCPNHVWHIDLTAVPTSLGFWAPWLPGALPQCWPFCWWVAVVIDHHSRRVMGIDAFRNNPTAVSVSYFLECAIQTASATPKYIICDKGQQFWCSVFKDWCDRHGITPRFGAVGQHGSIALIERFILSLKNECTRIILMPFRTDAFDLELTSFANWNNHSRPHSSLSGKTPHEVYHDLLPANERPRYEPRERWPRSAPCASSQAPVSGQCGTLIRLDVRYHRDRKDLPIVELRRAA